MTVNGTFRPDLMSLEEKWHYLVYRLDGYTSEKDSQEIAQIFEAASPEETAKICYRFSTEQKAQFLDDVGTAEKQQILATIAKQLKSITDMQKKIKGFAEDCSQHWTQHCNVVVSLSLASCGTSGSHHHADEAANNIATWEMSIFEFAWYKFVNILEGRF
ncbi:MAG: hypothetical protein A3I05_01150 [Deltaproteobacteria bacterium RIFCSPLOWO2_02_FULL_44_10]|nr:MAG: hypothetical protein A3C46_02465 [Deltaproteobacteria bacterium RIFCSPHIGHO2_02_FULL_44_16]OGQ47333.1 MAG: hypothetical protein A3I05_01150 [Deltaproteobacteria bacterium RIFCSPLOWO2_02_FULL_44_10]